MVYKELYPIVLACHIRGSAWAHRPVQFYCDNQTAVHTIRSGSSKNDAIMYLLRELFLISAKFYFQVSAVHVPGKINVIADAISRFKLQDFHFRLASSSEQDPSGYNQLTTKSTRKTYSAAQRRFLEFCYWSRQLNDNGSPLPASEWTLMLFATVLSCKIKASSIKVYLVPASALYTSQMATLIHSLTVSASNASYGE